LRRGKETVYKKWNMPIAILSGDLMMIKATQLLCETETQNLKQLLEVFNKTAVEVCEGQQIDMNFETQKNVSHDEYLEMIKLKTAVLLGCSLQIGALIGGAGNDILSGGSGTDTAVVTVAAGASGVVFDAGALTVTSGSGTDTLSGIELVNAVDAAGVVVKTYAMVDALGGMSAAITAAPNGSVLVKGNTDASPLGVSLADASAALAKGLSFYGSDTITVTASASDLLAKGSDLGAMNRAGVDSFITTDVVSPSQYATLVANSGGSVVVPTPVIREDESGVANIAGGGVVYTFTFDQAVTGFAVEDVAVVNGTKGALVASTVAGEEGKVFTLTVTPNALQGDMTVNVANSATSTQAVDTIAPTAPSIHTVGGANVFADAVQVTLSGAGSDVISSATTVTVSDGVRSVNAQLNVVNGQWTADVTTLTRGALSVSADVVDAAGNHSISASKTV
jgi:hypothetical protein